MLIQSHTSHHWIHPAASRIKDATIATTTALSVTTVVIATLALIAMQGYPLGPFNMISATLGQSSVYALFGIALTIFSGTILTIVLMVKSFQQHRIAARREILSEINERHIPARLCPGQYWLVDHPHLYALIYKNGLNRLHTEFFVQQTDRLSRVTQLGLEDGQSAFEANPEYPIEYVREVFPERIALAEDATRTLRPREYRILPFGIFVLRTHEGVRTHFMKSDLNLRLLLTNYSDCLAFAAVDQIVASVHQLPLERGQYMTHYSREVDAHFIRWIAPDGSTGWECERSLETLRPKIVELEHQQIFSSVLIRSIHEFIDSFPLLGIALANERDFLPTPLGSQLICFYRENGELHYQISSHTEISHRQGVNIQEMLNAGRYPSTLGEHLASRMQQEILKYERWVKPMQFYLCPEINTSDVTSTFPRLNCLIYRNEGGDIHKEYFTTREAMDDSLSRFEGWEDAHQEELNMINRGREVAQFRNSPSFLTTPLYHNDIAIFNFDADGQYLSMEIIPEDRITELNLRTKSCV